MQNGDVGQVGGAADETDVTLDEVREMWDEGEPVDLVEVSSHSVWVWDEKHHFIMEQNEARPLRGVPTRDLAQPLGER